MKYKCHKPVNDKARKDLQASYEKRKIKECLVIAFFGWVFGFIQSVVL